MSTPAPARYCDGETLRSREVLVEATDDGKLRVTGENVDLLITVADLTVSDALGHVPRFARLPGGKVLEIDADAFEALLPQVTARSSRLSHLVHRLESKVAVAAAATVLLVAGVAVMLWQGLPRLARRAAYLVPPRVEAEAGEKSYEILRRSFQPATTDFLERDRVESQLGRLLKVHPIRLEPRVHYLRMGSPNAFALPGGIIIVADELVKMDKLTDDEIAAILAHELGHIEKRHGVQSILRSSSALVVVATVTGDLSTLTSFAGTLPFMLLQSGYSREFEREADAYAVDYLKAAKIDPGALADALDALEKTRPDKGPGFSYLSTHPSTSDRIHAIRGDRPKKP